jgi:hypothetical protein
VSDTRHPVLRTGMWAAALAGSVIGSNFAWPLLGIAGFPEVGWWVSLSLLFVAAPIAGILFVLSLHRAVRGHRRCL